MPSLTRHPLDGGGNPFPLDGPWPFTCNSSRPLSRSSYRSGPCPSTRNSSRPLPRNSRRSSPCPSTRDITRPSSRNSHRSGSCSSTRNNSRPMPRNSQRSSPRASPGHSTCSSLRNAACTGHCNRPINSSRPCSCNSATSSRCVSVSLFLFLWFTDLQSTTRAPEHWALSATASWKLVTRGAAALRPVRCDEFHSTAHPPSANRKPRGTRAGLTCATRCIFSHQQWRCNCRKTWMPAFGPLCGTSGTRA